MELRSILEMQACLLLFLGGVVLLAHQTSRAEDGNAAARWFFVASVSGATGLWLQSLQGQATPWLTVILGNALFALLIIFLYRSIALTVGHSDRMTPYLLAAMVMMSAMQGFYTFRVPDVTRRVLIASIFLPVLLLPMVLMLLRPRDRTITVAARTLAGIVLFFVAACAWRVVSILRGATMRSGANWSGAVLLSGVALCFLWMDLLRLRAELMLQAMTDVLTGLPNRRAMEIQGSKEVTRAERERAPLSMLTLDVDRFKDINDQYGHNIGDRALLAVADVLKKCLRAQDTAARIGGDEFVVLLTRSSEEIAEQIAERIAQEVAALDLRTHAGETFRCTVTIGRYTTMPSAERNYEHMMHASDMDFYARKQRDGATEV